MSRYHTTVVGTSLLIDYTDADLHVTLDRWRESRGDIWAEVILRTSRPGRLPHLHQSRWNLSSMSHRQALVRTLRSRWEGPDAPDWSKIIEQTALLGLEHSRTGEPVVMVGRMDRSPSPRYLLRPLLPASELSMLYGDGGSGKTLLAVAIALSVQEGLPVLGLTPEGREKVLFLDWETSAETLDARVKMVASGTDCATIPELTYRRCSGPLADQVDDLQRVIGRTGARWIIVDSVGAACGGEPESAEVVLRMVNAIRALQATTLLIDHTPKGGDEPFGSVYKKNACRMVWHLRREQDVDETQMHLAAFNVKTNLSRKHRPLGWRVQFDEEAETVRFRAVDVGDVAAFRMGLSVREQIRLYLAGTGAGSVKDISEGTGLAKETVSRVLRRMAGDRQVLRLAKEGAEDVKWGLLASVE